MFQVYVIRNTYGKIYIGHTADLSNRLARHNQLLPSKRSSYTKKFGGSWEVVYKEEFQSRLEAVRREKQLKSSRGRAYLRELL